MTWATRFLCSLHVATVIIWSQVGWSQVGHPAFEVASIKPSPVKSPTADDRNAGRMFRDAGRVSYSYVTPRNLLVKVWRVSDFRIPGPDWLDSERFDIEAKLPGFESLWVRARFR
jgi:hypothetical protein